MNVELNLNSNQKELIKQVDEMEKPTTEDIHESKELYSGQDGTSHALSNLKEKGLLDPDTGERGKHLWKLSEKGKQIYRQMKQEEAHNDSNIEIYDRENAKQVLIEYFEEHGEEERLAAAEDNRSLRLDYKNLEKFDHELADDLFENPKEVLKAAEEALQEFPLTPDSTEIRITGIPEREIKKAGNISPGKDDGKLVAIKGVLKSSSSSKAELKSAQFKCTNCGQATQKEQNSGKVKSPYKCRKCGSEKFTKVNVSYESVRIASIKSEPGSTSSEEVRMKLTGDIAEEETDLFSSTGPGIRVIGILNLIKKNKSDEFFEPEIQVKNLELEKERWEDLEITEEDRKRIKKFKEQKDNFKKFRECIVRSIAQDEIAGMQLLKEATAVWLLGKNENSNLHVLVIGEPGLGKSQLANHITEKYPRLIKSVGTGSTGAGLTASVRKDKLTGDWIAEAGAVPQAHEGFHILDEADKTDDDELSKLNEALSDKNLSIDKANINTEIPVDVSEMLLGNPENSTFDGNKPVYEQIPFKNEDFINRFDIKLALKMDDIRGDKEKREEVADFILSGPTSEEEFMEEDLLVKYFHIAQKYQPVLPEEVEEKIKNIYHELSEKSDAVEGDGFTTLTGPRGIETLKHLSKAYAKMDLVEEVKLKHLKRAFSFLQECYQTMDFEIGRDTMGEDLLDVRNCRAAVRQKINNLEDTTISEDKLTEEINHPENRVEETLEKLKDQGELYSPEQGKVGKIK